MSESNSISIRFADEFENNVYRLSKKYRSIRSDIEPVIQQIQAGNIPGDRIPNLGTDYFVYKVRVNNSNIQKGKRAGYRLIYQVESETSVLLLTIYSKLEKEDIQVAEIFKILNDSYHSEDDNNHEL